MPLKISNVKYLRFGTRGKKKKNYYEEIASSDHSIFHIDTPVKFLSASSLDGDTDCVTTGVFEISNVQNWPCLVKLSLHFSSHCIWTTYLN